MKEKAERIEKTCPHCGIKTENPMFCSRSCATIFTNKANPKRPTTCDFKEVQKAYDDGMPFEEMCRRFHVSNLTVRKAFKNGKLIKTIRKRAWSEEMKLRLSESRKKMLKEHPENHPWRKNDKFKSIPCSVLKNLLTQAEISFVPEYVPLIDRFFSLDIAFPDKKVAIEVNGNQHYESDGRLKPYYQERHNVIEASGWKIIELHYSTVYNGDLIQKLISDLKQSHDLGLFDYTFYQVEQEKISAKREIEKKRKIQERKGVCGCCGSVTAEKTKTGLCQRCWQIKTRRVERPSKEELIKMIQELPMTKIGKRYGVSDNAVRKWCKRYGIEPHRRQNLNVSIA